MIASSHAAFGALIAVSINKPVIALPLALLSHFALDAIPHFGYPGHEGIGAALKHKVSKFISVYDPLLFLLLLGLLFRYSASFYVFIAAFLAALPDIEWFVAYYVYERDGKRPKRSPLTKIHINIQWMERPWGLATDVFTYFSCLCLIIIQLK